jgi:nitronate monooxygenase
MWHQTKISSLLGIDYPIMLGPFGGGLSTVALTSAVADAGGLGAYGAYTLSAQEIYEVDRQIKAVTDKPYNLNLWVSDTDAIGGSIGDVQYEQAKVQFKPYFDELGIELPRKPPVFQSRYENQIQVVLDIKPKVFSFMFGIPSADILEACRQRGIKLVGAATTLDEAIALENAGVDMIIASGFEAGGHRPSFLVPAEQSTTGTFVLLQLLRDRIKVPVIAAGGIASGRGIAAALTLGADAVQIGTAFLACDESGALAVHKDALFSEDAKHTLLSRAYTGRLGRGISTRLARETTGKENNILPFPLQANFMSHLRKAALDQGRHDMILFWGGQIAPLLKHRKAADLMESLITEANSIF